MAKIGSNVIKFSDDYPKLWGQKQAILLDVKCVQKKELSKDLLEYDTKTSKGEYYMLPEGLLLQLIFLGDKRIPFCTLRKQSPWKEKYYRSQVGFMFEIVIGEQ
jgi:hypothetical protein